MELGTALTNFGLVLQAMLPTLSPTQKAVLADTAQILAIRVKEKNPAKVYDRTHAGMPTGQHK